VLLLALATLPADAEVLSTGDAGSFEVDLAARDGAIVAGWYDTRDGKAEIYLRERLPDGRMSPEIRVTRTKAQSYEVSLDAIDGGIALAWYEKSADGRYEAGLGMWQHGPSLVWHAALDERRANSRNPVVRAGQRGIFAAWIASDDEPSLSVYAAWWSASGSRTTPIMRLGAAGSRTWNLNAALASGADAWVAWDAAVDSEVAEITLARLRAGVVERWQVTPDDGYASRYPDIAIDAGRVAMTWFDERDGNREVYLASAPVTAPQVLGPAARRVTNTPGASIGAYLAFGSGRLGVAWCDDTSGSYDIFLQYFDPEAKPLSDALQLSDTDDDALIPAIRVVGDRFAVAWNEVQRGDRIHDAATRSRAHFVLVDANPQLLPR